MIRSLFRIMADARFARSSLALGLMAALFGLVVLSGDVSATPAGIALAGLSLLVTLVVIVFAGRQLRADPQRRGFIQLAAGLAVGTVLMAFAANVLLLAAGWIVTGRMMAGLIGHVGQWHEARDAARRATLAFTIGDLALVGAATLLALGAGSTDLGQIAARAPGMAPGMVGVAALLLVVAAMARCAIPPFSGWLLGSLAAPTPASALMHAGFVNAGGFLLVRLAPVLEAAPAARFALFAVGVAAALVGSAIMLVRSDIKGGLAASTMAQMGFMLLTVALGAYAAALWHMVAHGLFKAWQFLGSSGTVGAAPTHPKGLPEPVPAVIALVVLAVMSGALVTGSGHAILPVGLALAAALGALAVAARSSLELRAGLAVMAVPLVLISLNAAALSVLGQLQPDAATVVLSPVAQFALLSLFLGGWVWQQSVTFGGRLLHPALVARLLGLGTPAPLTSGLKD